MSSKTVRSKFLLTIDAIFDALYHRADSACERCGIINGSRIPETKLRNHVKTILKGYDLDPTNPDSYICLCANCAPLYSKLTYSVKQETKVSAKIIQGEFIL